MTFRITFHIILIFCFLANNLFGQQVKAQEPTFSVEQLKADLQYVRKNLAAHHPNLYLYTSKMELDRLFDSLITSLSKPLTSLEFYKHLSIISSNIKDGHTIILPSNRLIDYHNQNSKFLPYYFTILNNRLFVDRIYTNDHSIMEKAEILSINQVNASEIIKQLISRQVRDGNNLTYPTWILNHYFKSYYSYIFGHPDQFTIEYQQSAITKTTIVNGLTNDSIYYYRKLKYPTETNDKKPKEGLTLQFSADHKYAVLTIKDFHKEILKKEYQQNFKKVIRHYFEQLHKAETTHLVLDLRDNQGGDLAYGALLLAYLIDQPFTIMQGYYEVDHSKSNFQLKKSTGSALGIQQPKDQVFKGSLYLLTNGGSFSNSGIVAACLKRYNRATFIGEETGGNNQVLAGYIKYYTLPNSGIQVQIPTKQFLLEGTLPLTGRGTIPDYFIPQNLTDIIESKDTVLNFAIALIKKQKKE